MYLDRLDDELPAYSDEARLRHLKSKLRQELQDKTNAGPMPLRTRQEGVDLAIRLEQTEPSFRPKAAIRESGGGTNHSGTSTGTFIRGRGCGRGGYPSGSACESWALYKAAWE